MKLSKVSGYWVLVGVVTASAAMFAWFNGADIDPSPQRRVFVVCLLGLIALGWRAPLAASWRRSVRGEKKADAGDYERDAQARVTDSDAPDKSRVMTRVESLKTTLVEQYGWRWRHRSRWLLVVGDEMLVKDHTPELVQDGFFISGKTVLLYAKQTGKALDADWLDQIRRLRRRRPVDAIVALANRLPTANASFNCDTLALNLARQSQSLRWSAPVYLVDCSDVAKHHSETDEAIGFLWSNASAMPGNIGAALLDLARRLADEGVTRLSRNMGDRFAGELSQHIAKMHGALSDLVTRVNRSRSTLNAVHGLLFAPNPQPTATETVRQADVEEGNGTPQTHARPLWEKIADHSRKADGRRVGFSWSTLGSWIVIVFFALWSVGTVISGVSNRAVVQQASATLTKLAAVQDPTQSLLALDALDKQVDMLEIHRKEGAPWLARFGLSHDVPLLETLRPAYHQAAARVLIVPIHAKLEERLNQLASLSDAEIASGGNTQVQAAYDTLKTYLMLAHPEHVDTAFLATHLLATNAPTRPTNSSITPGTWEDLRQHAIAFYASHLKRDSAPAITPDVSLVASTRQTIIGVRGIQNSTDAIYQQIIEETKPKYPPITLATLLGDHPSRGLFNTTATVPGVFTRAAWDERIPKAIDEASEQRTVTGDWVLSDEKIDNTAPSTLKAELRQRYFDDYARAWAQFLNSIRWQNSSSLSGTVDQLTLLADPQRSPLVALMNAIVYQASAGASTQSLSDNLISKAQHWAGKDEKDPSKQTERELAPLAVAFGPILRLTGSDLAANAPANAKAMPQTVGDLSLPRYLERVTAMRLKTQQMMSSADPDAMSRLAAQAMLQGKTSDIADSRDYASRLAASLGEQWSGFGHLFEAPLNQTWQVVVQPASSSLNDIWRTSIVADWNRSFGGRYPFADADNDASLPDMARFMRPDNGVIAQFVTTELAGVVKRQGDQWVATQVASESTLALDPTFLAALNKLTRISASLFPSGDARMRFELRGVPTPGITDMKLLSSGQQLHYFNQMEQWVPFEWPGQGLDNNAQLQWQTDEGGLRSTMYAQGRFALIRLIERAKVAQQDNARYVLSWTPEQSAGLPLSVQLRADSGAGPLDVLSLRHFTLPTRIFINSSVKDGPRYSGPNPPPLPPGAVVAAQKIGVPLPGVK
jgi:type VI secretion system protein ImpL